MQSKAFHMACKPSVFSEIVYLVRDWVSVSVCWKLICKAKKKTSKRGSNLLLIQIMYVKSQAKG